MKMLSLISLLSVGTAALTAALLTRRHHPYIPMPVQR